MTISKIRAVGVFFLVVGAAFFWLSCATLKLGTPERMGAGFFPASIAAILFCFGIAVSLSARTDERIDLSDIPWRGIFFVCASVIGFALTFRMMGFVAATALMVFLSSLASRKMTLKLAIVLSASISALCTIIFIYGIGLPYRLY